MTNPNETFPQIDCAECKQPLEGHDRIYDDTPCQTQGCGHMNGQHSPDWHRPCWVADCGCDEFYRHAFKEPVVERSGPYTH